MNEALRGRVRRLGALLPLVIGLGLAAGTFWFVCDDAYISFRYARHLAQGMGLRFNPGESPPVEGYSNLLWVLIAAASEQVGVLPALTMPLVSLACAVLLLVGVSRTSDRLGLSPAASWLAAATFAMAPGVAVWSTSGLETMAEAALLFVLFDRLVLAGDWRRGAVAGALLSLVRTEGIAWVAVLLAIAALDRLIAKDARRGLGDLARAAVAVAVPYAAYAGVRLWWFGSLISNTAYVKVSPSLESAGRGLDYVLGYWVSTVAPPIQLLIALFAAWSLGRTGAWLLAMALGVHLYAVIIGGDFMTMGRMLVPAIAFSAVLVGVAADRALRRGGAVAALGVVGMLAVNAVGMLPLADINLAPRSVRDDFRVRFNSTTFRSEIGQWRYMRDNAQSWLELGEALHQVERPGDALVLGAVGAVGYSTELFIHDRYGLVSPEVARRETEGPERKHSPGHDKYVDVEFFLDQQPRFVRAEVTRLRSEGLRSDGVRGEVAVGKRLAEWRASAEVRANYGPAWYPVVVGGTPKTLLVLERMDDPAAAWAKVGALGRGGADARADDGEPDAEHP
jgi:arabinofuranosyltransferase